MSIPHFRSYLFFAKNNILLNYCILAIPLSEIKKSEHYKNARLKRGNSVKLQLLP
nr:MAG TPA: hypothetical protein [Caudoviricetes sp.]